VFPAPLPGGERALALPCEQQAPGGVGWLFGPAEQHPQGSLRLEKPSEIIKPNRHPNTPMAAKPRPQVPHPQGF